ncbi:MAG: TolB-like 6-bladed beta-propeller domain-containing protein [Tannerella sp.]|nr:TolB-like 6-bladed beta-propeller domain-containing protein [Tannerella sp.]
MSYDFFPEEIALHGEEIPLDTVLFRYPFRIAVREGIAVVMDLHNADYYLHAFTCPGGKHIASFGQRGEGPGEMLSAERFRFLSLDSLWALDANKMEISRWHIFPGERTARRVETISLDKSLIRSLDFYVTETGFILPDYSGEYRYHLADFSGKPVRAGGNIPAGKDAGKSAPIALAQAWRSFLDYHPRRDLLVMATQFGEVLELYHLNDTVHTVIYGPHREPEFRAVEGEGVPTGIKGFGDVQITDNYIYTIFHGRTFKEIQQAHQRGERPENGGRFIYVFDPAGNPVRKYTLDHSVSGIYVDEQAHIIFATDVNSDEPLVWFKTVQ